MKHIWRISLIVVVLVFILSIQTGVAGVEDKDIIMPSIEEETERIVMLEFSESDSPENIELNKQLLKDKMIEMRLYEERLIREEEERLKQEELNSILSECGVYCDSSEIYFIDTETQYTDEEIQLLAQCLYCEAGGTSWECQVITLSAILNHCDEYGGLWVLDSVGHFAVAPYYRYYTPQEEQYEVIEYVLSGHRIADVKYFRTQYFHGFGTSMLCIDGVYFSK